MAFTKDDLRDFNQFASERLENSGVDSLFTLVGEWQTTRQRGDEPSVRAVPPLDVNVDEKTLEFLIAAFPDSNDPDQLQAALARRGGLTTAQMLAKAVALEQKADEE